VHRSLPTLALLISCALWLSGCAMFGLGRSYEKPDISLANVEMLKANLWEQTFQLGLRVDNPNDRSLPIRGMHYEIYLNEARLATGVSDAHFTVPAYGSEYFELNVRSNLWRHIRDVVKMIEDQQPVSYRIEGHIRTGLFLSPTVTLHEKGMLDPVNLRF
jgi:LEA14-like dessication related protein